MKKLFVPIALILLLAVPLSACGNDSTTDAKKAFCDTLPPLKSAADNVKSISATTSVDQAKQYGNDLQKAWDNTKTSAAKLADVQVGDIQDAYDEMIREINSITDQASVAAAQAQIQASTAKFEASYSKTTTTVCPAK